MISALHKNARTTPAVRAEIAASTEPAAVLAARHGASEQTIYKWRKRDVFTDRSHTAHRLQTTLTPAQEFVAVALRRTLLLSLGDLLAIIREFLCASVSRSALDRCLRRHGVGSLNALKPQQPEAAHQAFKSYEPGFMHVDVRYLPQMPGESSRRYLFVAVDRAMRWVFAEVLTDNGKEFTDRLFASRERQPSSQHEVDQLCQQLSIEHRLTRPEHPAPTAWSSALTAASPMS